jgi:hypothetical protein
LHAEKHVTSGNEQQHSRRDRPDGCSRQHKHRRRRRLPRLIPRQRGAGSALSRDSNRKVFSEENAKSRARDSSEVVTR